MHRTELEHIIRASCRIAEQDQVLVIGSQSILGTYNEFELPVESTYSEEADVFPLFDDAEGSRSTQIDGAIGEWTQFHDTFGYYAQGVDRRTALLPEGWADRLVPIRNENTEYFTGWCLEVHDLCSSKLLANRDKDREFVQALIKDDLVLVSTIRDRIYATDFDPKRRDVSLTWLSMWSDEQPGYRAPELPVVPQDWPNHPAVVLRRHDAESPPVQRQSGQPSETPRRSPWDGSWPHALGGHEPGTPGQGHSSGY